MSVHKECGEQIRWARNQSDTKWIPPLEFAGEAFILTKAEGSEDYIASEVSTYRVHNCDPDKVLAWQEYKAKLEALESRKRLEVSDHYLSDREIAKQRDQELAWDEVHGVPCPRSDFCLTDGKCCNLSKAKQNGGEFVATVWPHPERVEAARGR